MHREKCPRILEIGYLNLTRDSDFDSRFIDFRLARNGAGGTRFKSLWDKAFSARREIMSGNHDILIVREIGRYIYRLDVSLAGNLIRFAMRHYLVYCAKMARRVGMRVLAVDMVDEPFLDGMDIRLMDHSDLYFKRELPANPYKAFARVKPHHQEPILKATSEESRRRFAKLRPISLGAIHDPWESERLDRELRFSERYAGSSKKFDVFFSGSASSLPRSKGIETLIAMREEGYNILILEAPVARQEFWDHLSSSWLAWSPEGMGWDCYRHYEAALARTVPLINQSPNLRYKPFINGKHALYYDLEEDGLRNTIVEALKNKARLLEMAHAARSHVLKHHTTRERCNYMVNAALEI